VLDNDIVLQVTVRRLDCHPWVATKIDLHAKDTAEFMAALLNLKLALEKTTDTVTTLHDEANGANTQ
jgi:hypothetical protein